MFDMRPTRNQTARLPKRVLFALPGLPLSCKSCLAWTDRLFDNEWCPKCWDKIMAEATNGQEHR